MSQLIRVLIIDDSAFARKVIREMLSRSPYIEVVGAARDGSEALELVEQLKPDVVTCDLMMPRMDGAAFIREQMRRKPVPILVLSVAEHEGTLCLSAVMQGFGRIEASYDLRRLSADEAADYLWRRLVAPLEHAR